MDHDAIPFETVSFAVKDPVITEVLDLYTGVHSSHGEIIGTDYAKAIQLRLASSTGIAQGVPRYACSLCGVPVYLVSRTKERRFFFRHTLEDGRCRAHTRGQLSQDEINARKYNGAKESHLHRQMKEWVAQSLAVDPLFSNIVLERRWSGKLTSDWRQPDVQATYRGFPIAFEIQLSTTYLNVIAGRRSFYLREGGLLFWIFASFDAGVRRLTQDDVFFNNNRNAFLVTQTTADQSIKESQFMLECIWAQPSTAGIMRLERTIVPFDQLTLEQHKQRAYYFDFDNAQVALEAQKSEALRQRQESLRIRFEDFWLTYAQTRKTTSYVTWGDLRQDLGREQIVLPAQIEKMPHSLLNALYSAKHGQVIGWRYKTFIEVAHYIEPGHRGILHYFRRALHTYGRADLIRHDDKSGKWASKVQHYKRMIAQNSPDYAPDVTHNALVEFLFPEIFRHSLPV